MSRGIENAESGEDATDGAYLVPGLERGLRILAEFSRKEPVLSAPEISRRLEIPRTTVFRLLQTLEQMGFVERTNREASFQPSVSALHLGFDYLNSLPVVRHGMPALQRLRDRIGLTVHLVIRDRTDIVYAARAEGPSVRLGNFKVNLGTRLPAHATVHGQVLLGDLDIADLTKLYSGPDLPRFSPHTPSTVIELHERILAASRQGYGISESYFESGVSAVSAPVRCKTGNIVAVVAVTIGRSKIDGDLVRDLLIHDVISTANEISDFLHGEYPARRIARGEEEMVSALR
ncbi:IclR family transcriptional regulator [Paraburkholderia terrae]|uniref:IclR family transcriptional regulator n=1 Tax=Paraburkholderia TaxID=1822464 RepID=UPI001EE1FF1E|nr:IclR family transcriptional regulator [Paraburkholderia terrae]BEU21185.1 IclR family transcriptional regulator [Paraburkholderia sp. 22B1P]GJH07154.1 helix-turn-helix domain-containing protein [Paraburkholderia terrae]